MEVESILPLGRRCQLLAFWRDPKQMTWLSAVVTTNLALGEG